MTTVPPPTAQPLPLPAQGAPAPVVLILAPPPAVAALGPGAVLEGVVLPQPPAPPDPDATADSRAAITIRTPQGDVTIRLPVALPPDSDVELQVVRASADQVTVKLVTVDDQPATQVLAQLRQAATAAQPAPVTSTPALPQAAAAALPPANAWTPLGPVALPALGAVSAFVIQGVPLPTPTAAPLMTANPAAVVTPQAPAFAFLTGGDVAVRITSVQLPGAGAIPSTPGSAPVSPQTITPPLAVAVSSPVGAPTVPVGPAAVPAAQTIAASPALPPGAQPLTGDALITAPQPNALLPPPEALPTVLLAGREAVLELAPPAPPAVETPPQATLTGTVISTDPKAPPVIATDLGNIQLNIRANLPAGARVVLDVMAQNPPLSGSGAGAAPPPAPMTTLPLSGPPGAAAPWPNLSEALTQLQRSDPVAAQQFAEAIPDGSPRTVVAIVAFAQAMRSGDPRQWPGDNNLRALERLGPRGAHLAAQIGDEVSALSTKAREPSPEWRMLPVPWNADGRIDRIALITRREGEADEAKGGKSRGGGTRFLINLDLTRLGALQLDGLFRRETRGFDLMIRTKAPLPDGLRLELTGVFADSTAAMGLKGGLTFQVVKAFADPLAGRPGLDKAGLWA